MKKRILSIYQKCRTGSEIQKAFDDLQEEMSQPIDEKIKMSRQKLLENFDEEVHEKLKIKKAQSQEYLNKHENWLWAITKLALKENADFESKIYAFNLKTKPFNLDNVPLGSYKIGSNINIAKAFIYGPNLPLAEKVINNVMDTKTSCKRLIFNYNDPSSPKISIIEGFYWQVWYFEIDKNDSKKL